MEIFCKIAKSIVSAYFPNTCISCGEIIPEDEDLCEYCFEMINRCDPLKRCLKCGLNKKNCECNKKVFYFEALVAPFYNNGVAKDAMYRYKFRKRESNADYFAKQMALCVKTEYKNIEFDGITYVPLSKLKSFSRGFDQCEVLARKMSEILDIKFLPDSSKCKHKRKSQHETPLSERVNNVKGRYSFNYSNYGRTLLLVDDIKTTGATLQECTKQLLLSGADRVYCVTGLITENKKKKV